MVQIEFISDTSDQRARKDMILLAKKHGLMTSLYKMRKIFLSMGYDNPVGLLIWLNAGKSEETYVKWLMEAPERDLWKIWK